MNLADRMKLYESVETSSKFFPYLPVIARMDGMHFHSFCRDLNRPYDSEFSYAMQQTTRKLVEETGARLGYTQSDEITLIFNSDDIKSEIFFAGRKFKMISALASMTTLFFNNFLYLSNLDYKRVLNPMFDARVWQVPNKDEAVNCLIWRELDATKNSITMAAQSYFSDKQLHEKNSQEKQDMLFGIGINWNDYPSFFKRGTYFQRRKVLRKYSAQEIESLPLKHNARTNQDLIIERSEVFELCLPPIMQVENKVAVVFYGDEPRGISQ